MQKRDSGTKIRNSGTKTLFRFCSVVPYENKTKQDVPCMFWLKSEGSQVSLDQTAIRNTGRTK